jgi:hypothetical protein
MSSESRRSAQGDMVVRVGKVYGLLPQVRLANNAHGTWGTEAEGGCPHVDIV